MAFPGNVNRYVISGNLPGGERFAVGFYGEVTLPGTAQALADDFDNAGSLGLALLTAMRALMTSNCSITRIQVYVYGAGRTIVDQGEASLSLAGTGTGNTLPNQCAVVGTLRTAVNSRRGRGRMYFPAIALGVGADGTATSGPVSALVTALAGAMGFYNAVVVSEAGTTSNPVNRVDADRVIDTQRRRSEGLTTSRISAVVT